MWSQIFLGSFLVLVTTVVHGLATAEQEALQLIRWFTKRYPTPAERLAYAQRSYARWTAHQK